MILMILTFYFKKKKTKAGSVFYDIKVIDSKGNEMKVSNLDPPISLNFLTQIDSDSNVCVFIFSFSINKLAHNPQTNKKYLFYFFILFELQELCVASSESTTNDESYSCLENQSESTESNSNKTFIQTAQTTHFTSFGVLLGTNLDGPFGCSDLWIAVVVVSSSIILFWILFVFLVLLGTPFIAELFYGEEGWRIMKLRAKPTGHAPTFKEDEV